jgi:polyvinyl alcohol dehydrogenase (cytochrome)|tara:strand:+ start:2407 stop:4371 length:1965 start_codon:yes stop_codon:yes gene_type:complete
MEFRVMAFRLAIRATFLISLSFLIVGCEQDNTEDTPAIASPVPELLASTDDMQTGAADFDRSTHPGKGLYEESCSGCHDGSVSRAPHFSWLEMMSASVIYEAMNVGVMSVQAAALADGEKLLITEYLTRTKLESGAALKVNEPPMCTDGDFDLSSPAQAVNWGHDTNRYSPSTVAGLTVPEIPNLELKWAFAFPDAFRARSQPTIAMGTVFVGSQDGRVYALDLETGCARWTFSAAAEVRTGIVLSLSEAPMSKDNPPLAYFGDIIARFYAVNALTGELVWSLKADDHPSATLTATPAFHEGMVFVPVSSLEVIPAADPAYECCTFRGSVLAIDATSGDVLWRHHTIPGEPSEVSRTSIGTKVLSPSGAPVWSSPTVDVKRGLIYVGTGENYSSPADENSDAVLAIDMATGARVWTRQSTSGDAWNVACMMADNPNCPPEDGPDFDHGSSILIVELDKDKDILLAGHKNGTVYALDPDNKAEVLWATEVGRGSIQGGVHFGMSAADTQLYVPINDMNNTRNGDYLDPEQARPGMHSIDANTGKLLWSNVQKNVCFDEDEFCDPGISSAVTSIPGAVFAGHLDGFVRAYASGDGALLWEYDTRPERVGVNGIAGYGGSMSGAGPAIVAGHLVINSGYGLYNHEPGNLLMVFAVPE